ncbi:hypothetical protein ACFE04_017861 [Oxalis oulophora]
MNSGEREAMLGGLSNAMHLMFGFVDSMAIKCAVELRLADIIHSQGQPIPLSKIASLIDSTSHDISYLERIMRLLVVRKVFTVNHSSDGGEPLYGLSPTSKWLLHDAELNLAPMILLQNHPLFLAPWHYFSQCVKQGGSAFEMAHGSEPWEFKSKTPELNQHFNDGMACMSKIQSVSILEGYKDGFSSLTGTLVDVGGGIGLLIAKIVKAHPHIKAINFDLPQVIDTAPQHKGVTHIAGDMFVDIPKGDAVFMKTILHDWSDEDCVKILKNCQKAIPKEGKLIIVEIILQPEVNSPLGDISFIQDLCMIAHTMGKERTEVEWKDLLAKGGFPRYKVSKGPHTMYSIIEAFMY